MQFSISFTLSDSFITAYRSEYFDSDFQEEDVNRQILESVDLRRKMAKDIVNSIRKEKTDTLFSLLNPLYNAVENFDGGGLIEMSITNKDEVFEGILADIENVFITEFQMNEELRKETAKEIFDAIRNLE